MTQVRKIQVSRTKMWEADDDERYSCVRVMKAEEIRLENEAHV